MRFVSLLLLLTLAGNSLAEIPVPQRLRMAESVWVAPQAPEGFRTKIAEGEITEAWASWWGYDATDATEALQAAIHSNVPKLVIDNPGGAWIVRPIFLASNQRIIFAPGVVIEAKRGEFTGTHDSLFSIIRQQRVSLIGNGATLKMHRSDYADPEQYEQAEWRHALNIRSSTDVVVENLTLAESGGDGIYLGVSGGGEPNRDVTIRNVICDRNYRQGISVISARNLLIEDSIMRNTWGTPPSAGINFEPNYPNQELVNCVVRRSRAENNQGTGYLVYTKALQARSADVSLRLEDCTSVGNRNDLVMVTGNSLAAAVGGKVEVVRGRFEDARGSAIVVQDKPVDGIQLELESCAVLRPAADDPETAPIQVFSRFNDRSVGGIDFGDITLYDPLDRSFLNYRDHWAGGIGVKSLEGTVRIHRRKVAEVPPLPPKETHQLPDWAERTYPPRSIPPIYRMDLTGAVIAPWMTRPTNWDPTQSAIPFLRGLKRQLTFMAEQGDTIRIAVHYEQVGRYAGTSLPVKVIGPSGTLRIVGSVPFKSASEVAFTATEDGLHWIVLAPSLNKIAVRSSSHPLSISGVDGPIKFIRARADLYFLVPPGLDQFGVLVAGVGGGEWVQAALFDPRNSKVWDPGRIALPEMFVGSSRNVLEPEVWRLQLGCYPGYYCEDGYVDLRGLPPFLAPDPAGLLKVVSPPP